MRIIWNQNPLRTVVELDEQDKRLLLLSVQNERYANILCEINLWLSGKIDKNTPQTTEEVQKRINKWEEVCNMDETHHEVQLLVEELQGSHGGDCVCWPCTCFKCLAEDHLGISTTKDLGKHEGSYIMGAFGKNGDRTIDEAIESLKTKHSYETRNLSWAKYSREEYEKHIPRWESEKKNALEWLQKYKEEHGF
jgi:hypothetical protein